MEVYIKDMVVKSLRSEDHPKHLEKAFRILHEHKMMPNPVNCMFGIPAGKFFGFIITQRGIEMRLNQFEALRDMPSPKIIHKIQRLSGRIDALSQFVFKSTKKCQPFLKLLRKRTNWEWTPECEAAFNNSRST